MVVLDAWVGRGERYFRVSRANNISNAEEKKNQQQQEQQPKDFFIKLMEEKVRTAVPERPLHAPTICEVPEDLAEGNKGAYIPKVVCIGPLSDGMRGTPRMLRMERYKWCCVRKLIAGSSAAPWSKEHALLLGKCLRKMMFLAPRIRASYSSGSSVSATQLQEHTSDDEQQLARNMVLDGCFILHRLLRYGARESPGRVANIIGEDDDWTQVLGRCWVWGTVKRDLLLLSNQVPFFVVRKLFKLLLNKSDDEGLREDVLVQGALRLFSSLHPRPMTTPPPPIACHDVRHLLHLFYLSIDLPPPPQEQEGQSSSSSQLLPSSAERTWWVPCAKELDEAGVSFKPRKRGARSFLDVRFAGGALEIPPLQLYDYSEPLFRNLMALEQTYPDTPGHFTAYAIFMDCLLKATKDVRLLHEAHTSPDRNYLAGVMEEVVRYQSARWPRWRAALTSNYFTNPWVTTSVVVAALLLALTVLQTFYSVYSYYKPL
ncbi:hypothetical protein EJB05_27240, partial [Eragrostis curvula]